MCDTADHILVTSPGTRSRFVKLLRVCTITGKPELSKVNTVNESTLTRYSGRINADKILT